ncbi:hypothetical protein LSH36_304g05012 [Paralvinella palmiformis]|uniref:Tetraspanin n=1 Tax=Paralvinella palmiformis TaxID=53620 RepID=A0AAD9JIA5_9ANNE|nr:hypothetical protein LSH36_304g05012 [Paralvinella palmiformis]
MYGQYTAQGELSQEHFKKFKCLKYAIYAFSLILLVSCLLMIAGCVYMLVEWSFLDDIMNYDIPVAAMWILILGGSLTVLFIMVTGCCGASRESKTLLLLNIGLLSFTLIVFLAGTVCAVVWQTEIGVWVTIKMEKSLKEVYGVNLQNNYNRYITQQWDQAQRKMKCCGIRDEGWGIYRQSRWFTEQPYFHDDSLEFNYGTARPMVPESCCKVDDNGRIYNLNKCQRFSDGPPYYPQLLMNDRQEYNNALLYEGCYSTSMRWIEVMSGWLMGLGLGLAALMGILIVQWLERCVPNFPVVGSNLARACKTGIPRPLADMSHV